jgi:hypothetical protein
MVFGKLRVISDSDDFGDLATADRPRFGVVFGID